MDEWGNRSRNGGRNYAFYMLRVEFKRIADTLNVKRDEEGARMALSSPA